MFDDDRFDAQDVGCIILLGKYVDYEDNTLKNDDGTYMSMKDMEEKLKVSNSTIKRFIKRMLETNVMFKKKDETDKFNTRLKFYINPHILYKGKFIDKKIKEKLDQILNKVKNGTKGDDVDKVSIMIENLQNDDYSDLSDDEIDIVKEELSNLIF